MTYLVEIQLIFQQGSNRHIQSFLRRRESRIEVIRHAFFHQLLGNKRGIGEDDGRLAASVRLFGRYCDVWDLTLWSLGQGSGFGAVGEAGES